MFEEFDKKLDLYLKTFLKRFLNTSNNNAGSMVIEFIIIIPVFLLLFSAFIELSFYYSEKYKFRLDVYYLSRSLATQFNNIDLESQSNSSSTSSPSLLDSSNNINGIMPIGCSENQSSSYMQDINKSQIPESKLLHKRNTKNVCDTVSSSNFLKYPRNYIIQNCKIKNDTVFLEAQKVYRIKIPILRPVFNITSYLSSSIMQKAGNKVLSVFNQDDLLILKEYMSFKTDLFKESSNKEWNGHLLTVSSFENNPKLRLWVKNIAELYKHERKGVSEYGQKARTN